MQKMTRLSSCFRSAPWIKIGWWAVMLAEVLLQKKMTVIWKMTILFRKNGQCDLSVIIKKKHAVCQVGAPYNGSVFELCRGWPRPRLCSYNFRFWFCSSLLISMQNHHHESKSQLTWNTQLHCWRFNRFLMAPRWILSSDENELIFCNTFVYVCGQRLQIKTLWCDEH